MISAFFIDRPIFATVLSVLITLAGGLALFIIPVAQYPAITPPAVSIAINYPGASAQVVANTVAAPIEQQVNGVEGMLYMSSQSGNDGSYQLTVTFEVGTDLNTALVLVQNRVALAMPQLPTEVQLQGITIRKRTPDILQVISFVSPDGRYDNIYLSNFATINVRDELLRVEGVSDINVFGQRDYSIRVWLDPHKAGARSITANDIAKAIRAQNLEAAPGRIGEPPDTGTRAFEFTVDTLGRLVTPEQFANIIVKAGQASLPPPLQTANATTPPTPAQTTFIISDLTTSTIPAATSTTLTVQSGFRGTGSNMPSLTSPAPSGTSSAPGTTGGGTTGGPATNSGTAGGSSGVTAGTSGSSASTPGGSTSSIAQMNDQQAAALSANAWMTGGVVGPNALPGGGLAKGPWPNPALVRISDLGTVELGAQSYTNGATFDGLPAVGLAIHLLPGENALDVADRVRARMKELEPRFPKGVEYNIAYDTTPFIRESIQDVVQTLFEAIGLVALVVLVFLQNWRAAIIPLAAVPVAIIGTFAVMALLGFTLNNISLFGLVLAIGIVVDDAIVVVENVERWLEKGLNPREAARKAMEEVTGPIIAIALVLCAVFVPCAFVGGITGQFFRQFAVTITASTIFSTINSLTLSPSLAALLMRPHSRRDIVTRGLDAVLGWFFWLFNTSFEWGTSAYGWLVGWLLRGSLIVLLFDGMLLALTYWVFQLAPMGFVPDQDQGRLIISVQLPDSASLERTQAAMAQVDAIVRKTPGVNHTATAAGMSLLMSANSSNFGTIFVILDPFEKRRSPELSSDAIMAKLRKEFTVQVQDASVVVFGAPPIPGLSVASGFKIMVEDRGGMGLADLQQQTDILVGKLQHDPAVVGVLTQFRSKTPQLYLDVDHTKCQALGVPINDANQTMQIFLGSLYVNSFNDFGRHWQVTTQAEGRFRIRKEDVGLLQVRNNRGEMVPLSTLVTLRNINGPVTVTRYNLYASAAVSGNVPPKVSSGEAITAVDAASQALPRAMATEWTELMFLQIRAGNTAIHVFLLAIVFVFLALAALYESWALPLAVILVVPMCLLCSVGGVLLSGKPVDIFVQTGLIVLVGLACKNAILIVEFAHVLQSQGKPRHEAVIEASRLRLRPILMTSLAFILGVVPLVLASGAGAEMRRSLGIAVFSGMLGVTAFGIFLTPVFFDLVQRAIDSRLFESAVVRWGGTALLGGICGGGLAHLFARVLHYETFWPTVAGVGIGAVSALIVPALWPEIRRGKVVSPRAQTSEKNEPPPP
jgi:multidrug efflux pump